RATTLFRKAGAECWLPKYEDVTLYLPEGVKVWREDGHKWQFAKKYLKPELIEEFDYIFLWDDDIDILEFCPIQFIKIMWLNNLDMAQPALTDDSYSSHAITVMKPSRPPLGNWSIVGRRTNFVEIMVPAFTREAWR